MTRHLLIPLFLLMRLSDHSIQLVRDLHPSDIIRHYIKLDAKGKGCCPFHNEKTPSFHVSKSKGIFKCFGCGEAGDGIAFVMKHDKLEFIEAVERIASMCGVTLEYEEVPDKELYEKEKAFKTQLKETLRFTVDHYRNNLLKLPADHPVAIYLASRNITKEIITEWQLGWSTEEWQHLAPTLINQSRYEPASKLGLIHRSKDDRNYDGFRSRITIPITNRHGEYIGLAGRFIEIDPNDRNKNYPKYINPPQNDIYDKSKVLFGLSRADKHIERTGFAFLVEGYFDVISMHANRDNNTVGTCGTALTEDQAQMLRKYTSHVAVLRDADEAGRKAAQKDLLTFLRAGMKVDIVVLPDKEDPDSYTQKLVANHYLAGHLDIYDGVYWQADNIMRYAGDEFKKGKAQEAVLHLLTVIPNSIIRDNYFDGLCKKYNWKKPQLQKQLLAILDEKEMDDEDDDDGRSNLDKMPKWFNRQEFMEKGYVTVNNPKRTGYYSVSGENWIEITNFIIKPLFHIYAGKESRHLIQIDNGRKKAVLDIESRALVSIDLLQQYVVCEGPYIIYGSKPQMLRIATDLLGNFPRCLEIKFLGWQTAGFFAFVDKIYMPGTGIMELDEWGIIKHNDLNYLLPAASAAYKELQQTGDDPYEADRCLTYIKSTIDFATWAKLMNRVFLEKGPVAIAFTILTTFRDIIFDIDNNCPHLYFFGERSSGKSKCAESIDAVFFKKRSAFNLNSGTDFAFFAYMQRFINCPAVLNEFDEAVIKPEWFQVIKGVFDGEGRQRGVMGSKNRTEIMKVRSPLLLIGQYLCTMDDNSIVSRSCIEGFNEREMNQEDKEYYDQLKAYEEKGLSSLLVELLQHRTTFKEQYRDSFNEVLSEWRRDTAPDHSFNQRIMQNWAHLFSSYKIISEKISLPITADAFKEYCKKQALRWSKFIRSSDTLSEFWNTFAFLCDQGTAVEGWDYKIVEVAKIRLRKDRNEEYTKEFTEPTKLLLLRMQNTHKHYQQAHRVRTGKEGMNMDNLMHYFSSRKYFLGTMKQNKFKRFIEKTENVTSVGPHGAVNIPRTFMDEEITVSSCHVFLYDELDLEIERHQAQPGMFDNETDTPSKKNEKTISDDDAPF
jgi:DNA primase